MCTIYIFLKFLDFELFDFEILDYDSKIYNFIYVVGLSFGGIILKCFLQ